MRPLELHDVIGELERIPESRRDVKLRRGLWQAHACSGGLGCLAFSSAPEVTITQMLAEARVGDRRGPSCTGRRAVIVSETTTCYLAGAGEQGCGLTAVLLRLLIVSPELPPAMWDYLWRGWYEGQPVWPLTAGGAR